VCIIIASIGSGRKIGFLISLLVCLLTTPLIGLIVILISKSKSDVSSDRLTKVTNKTNKYHIYLEATKDQDLNIDLKDNETAVTVSLEDIPNNEKGQYISLYNTAVKNGKKSKKNKPLFYLACGGLSVTINSPVTGKVKYLKNMNDFIKVGETVCIIES